MTENTQSVLTVDDMVALKNIIDLASSRGAFRGEELTSVGVVYSRLAKFLDSVPSTVEAAQQAAESTEETTDETKE